MRAFIFLSLLVAAVNAGKLGYVYGPGISDAGRGIIQPEATVAVTSNDGGLINLGSSDLVDNSGISGDTGYDALDSASTAIEQSKQLNLYTAPDVAHNAGTATQQLSNVGKKNIQVVFIKIPEKNIDEKAAIELAKQAVQQQTDIYLLSKESNAAQVVNQLKEIQESIPPTPQVKFIKYRTPEDIAHAKHAIQSQYESVGGTSQNIDGGVAPVLNYVSGGVRSGQFLQPNVGFSSIGYGPSIGVGNVIGGGNYVSTNSPSNYISANFLKK